jgi:hypothetical protein
MFLTRINDHSQIAEADLRNDFIMDLAQAGIALKCRCGTSMAADMDDIQFDDRGRVRISGQDIRCPRCGAIYRRGERLKYHLVRIEGKF